MCVYVCVSVRVPLCECATHRLPYTHTHTRAHKCQCKNEIVHKTGIYTKTHAHHAERFWQAIPCTNDGSPAVCARKALIPTERTVDGMCAPVFVLFGTSISDMRTGAYYMSVRAPKHSVPQFLYASSVRSPTIITTSNTPARNRLAQLNGHSGYVRSGKSGSSHQQSAALAECRFSAEHDSLAAIGESAMEHAFVRAAKSWRWTSG